MLYRYRNLEIKGIKIFVYCLAKIKQMEKPLLSVKYFKEGASCSQAILATYGPNLGLTQEECYRIGAGLGGGIGRRQYICGAINAGAIIIGLKHGNSELSDNNKKEITSKLVSEFVVECPSIRR